MLRSAGPLDYSRSVEQVFRANICRSVNWRGCGSDSGHGKDGILAAIVAGEELEP